jgi:hypothetical protein
LPLSARISARSYPSVFQAWSPAEGTGDRDPDATAARHDLLFSGPSYFGLRWDRSPEGLAEHFTPQSIAGARSRRAALLARNPHLVLLAEIRYYDAHRSFLPEEHPWWLRDAQGRVVVGWAEGGYWRLNPGNPQFRRHVAAQCKAAVDSGVVDGVMLDWWQDTDDHLALIRAVRAAVGERALILGNANDRQTPRTASYLNGYFMECYATKTPEDWRRVTRTLDWAERHLRIPRVNCLEFWYQRSRRDLGLMRAVTTLALTHSDGYCLFSDPNDLPAPDHLHDWYPFWAKRLGRPVGPGRVRPDGASQREFQLGTVVYNPLGNRAVTLTFRGARRSVATGVVSRRHRLAPADGDLYLKH